jgi:hypothetical protein
LSASPSLHRLIHPDADDANHECAVTLFAHAQVLLLPKAIILAVVILGFVEFICLPRIALLPIRPRQLPPGRGPPVMLP